MQPHYCQSSRGNATPSSGTSILASHIEIPRPYLPTLPRWGTAETTVVGRWKNETSLAVTHVFFLSVML